MASVESKRWYQTLFFWCATILFIPIAGFFGIAVHPKNLTIWHEIEYWAVVGTFYTTCVGFVLFAKQYVHLLGSIGRQFSVVLLMCNVVAALYAMAVVDKWDRHLLFIAGIFFLYVIFDSYMIRFLSRNGHPNTRYREIRLFVDGPTCASVLLMIGFRRAVESPLLSPDQFGATNEQLDIFIAGAMGFMLALSLVVFLFHIAIKPPVATSDLPPENSASLS